MIKVLSGLALGLALIPRVSNAQAKLDRVALGYSAAWRDGPSPVAEYDFDQLNYICRAFLQPMPDGSVGVPDGYFNPALDTLAHQHGVKLLMSIGGGDAKSADWVTMATHPDTCARFIDQLGQLMKDHHYDGVDVDWEPADPQKVDGDAYGSFLKALRARFPQIVITTALPTDSYQTRFTPWADVVANVNYINVMAYDYSGPWGGVAGHGSGLGVADEYKEEPGHNVQDGMQYLIKTHALPPGKLLLGMTFWAYRYRADHLGDPFKKNTENVSDVLSYQQIQALLEIGRYQAMWDEKAVMPYVERTGGGSVICFENPESVRRKCDYGKSLGCAGVMVWNLGADITGAQTPLMDALMQSCGGHRHSLSHAALENEVTDMTQALTRETQANPGSASAVVSLPAAPPSLPSLTRDQLETLIAELQFKEGIADDALWTQESPALAAKH